MLEKIFHLEENHTSVRTEINAGITSFVTMAYILAVNPSLLSAAGMDAQGVMLATALASCLGCFFMAAFTNYPIVLAPGMGLNAYFAFTVCGSYGYSWQIALFAVFIEGLIFILLSVSNVREALFNAIPLSLKHGASVGIGLFIAFIGLQNAGIIIANESTLVEIVPFRSSFHTAGICALLALLGTALIGILFIRGVKGYVLIGMGITWLAGILCQLAGLYIPDAKAGYYSMIPSSIFSTDLTSIRNVFGQAFRADFSTVSIGTFITIIFAFLFVDLFDTLGALIGLTSKAGLLDEDGRLPRIKGALLADAAATTAGAIIGTSTVTTYAESSAGIAEGGRTGLTSVTTGLLFILALFFAPLFTSIPSCATAPALIFVGFLMLGSVAKIDLEDPVEAIPAYLAILFMPMAYSISEGLAMGIISYVILHVFTGRKKEVTPLMYVLAVLFILKYIFL
ncbi:MAG: NCS2 family permease [Lachnospiraceae bacterium]